MVLFSGTNMLITLALLSRVKTTLNSGVILEKTQRLEVIQGGLGLDQCVFPTPNDPNQAVNITGWLRTFKTTLNSAVIREKTQRLEVIQSGPWY